MKNTKFKLLTFLLVILSVVAGFSSGWAKSVDGKVKDWIDDASEALKKGVDEVGNDISAIQNYLDNYHWKGVIQEKAQSGAVSLKHLEMNGHSKAVVVKPGERIEGVIQCDLDREQCSPLHLYRVVLGIKGQGAQTTIGNELGVVAGKSTERFTLIAPSEPGMYQIRFRLVESLLQSTALNDWVDDKGNEPDGTTTIGIIFVKS
jgi:hypothetical protein